MLYRQTMSLRRYRNGFMKAEMEPVYMVSLVRIQNCSATNLHRIEQALSFDGQTLCQNVCPCTCLHWCSFKAELSELCNSICLFFNSEVTPTVWTTGYAISYHAMFLFDQFVFGVGINTIQGREGKHSVIAKFAVHSTPALCWSLIF